MVVPLEVAMYFDVWAADDLVGAAIGTLTEVEAASIRVVDNGMGSGEFTINRNSSEFATLCQTDNLIRVRFDASGPFDFDDTRYVHAFFIEEGDDTLLSTDEEGGQTVRIVGRGIEAYLGRAIIDYNAHHPINLTPVDFSGTAMDDGQWHINDSDFVTPSIGTPGSVLRVFLRDADDQTPQPIPIVSTYPTGHDFNVDNDSNSVPWDTGATDWSFDVGTDLLTVLGILVNGGLYYHMFPSMLLQAYEDRQGSDLSGSVLFEAGVNVATSGTRQIHASPAKSRVLVRGANSAGRYNYHWSEDTDVEDEIGVRQGYTEYGASPTPARLERAGQKLLTALKNQHDGPPIIGVLNSSGMVALEDYLPGDTVGLDIPDYAGDFRIHAISLVMGETGSVEPVLEFTEDAVADFTNPIAETTNGCCGCSDGDVRNPEDAEALWVYRGQYNGPHLVGVGTGSGEGYTVTAGSFIPGTLAVFAGGAFIVPASQTPEDGIFVATVTAAVDVYASWRAPCDDTAPC